MSRRRIIIAAALLAVPLAAATIARAGARELLPGVTYERLEQRTTGFKDWEPTRLLNEEVCRNRYRSEGVVDATALDPAALLAHVMGLLRPATPGGGP